MPDQWALVRAAWTTGLERRAGPVSMELLALEVQHEVVEVVRALQVFVAEPRPRSYPRLHPVDLVRAARLLRLEEQLLLDLHSCMDRSHRLLYSAYQ